MQSSSLQAAAALLCEFEGAVTSWNAPCRTTEKVLSASFYPLSSTDFAKKAVRREFGLRVSASGSQLFERSSNSTEVPSKHSAMAMIRARPSFFDYQCVSGTVGM